MKLTIASLLALLTLSGCAEFKQGYEYGYQRTTVVKAFEQRHGDLPPAEEEQVYQAALQSCAYLRDGKGEVADLILDMTNSRIPEDMAITIVSAATVYVCKDQKF